MHRFYTFLLFIISVSTITAQSFAPMGAKWTYQVSQPLSVPMDYGKSYIRYEVLKDTVVYGQNAKQIGGSLNHGCTYFSQFIYESNDSVFFYNNYTSQFDLLYCFDAQVGDKWSFVVLWGNFVDSMIITVNSIETISVNGNNLRKLNCSYQYYIEQITGTTPQNENVEIVEKIGSLGAFLCLEKQLCATIIKWNT